MWQLCITTLFFCASYIDARNLSPNEYMDYILNVINPKEAQTFKLDPALLGAFTTFSSEEIGGINNSARMKYYDGFLTGWMIGNRYEDCVPYPEVHPNVTITCMLMYNEIKIQQPGRMKYNNLPTKAIKVRFNNIPTLVFVNVTASIGKPPHLLKAVLREFSGFIPSFTGLGNLTDSLKNMARRAYVRHTRASFFEIFHQKYVPVMEKAIPQLIMRSS